MNKIIKEKQIIVGVIIALSLTISLAQAEEKGSSSFKGSGTISETMEERFPDFEQRFGGERTYDEQRRVL
ncbi:MAG: hypothetical protein JW714_03685, partial [Candidatus Omnitrophica bacterium]|nr:hypothetical protein [Candidatus Omnitrophota bacterium]